MNATTMYATTAPDEARGDVEGAARAHRVVRDRGDDLARRELRAHRRPRARRVVRDDLGEPERGLEPVEDGEAVPHDAGERLDRGRAPSRTQRPVRERAVVVVDDPVLDRAADRERHQRLRDHPRDAEEARPPRACASCCRPTQTSRRAGERVSGRPGSASGSWIRKRFSMARRGAVSRASIVATRYRVVRTGFGRSERPAQPERTAAAAIGTARNHDEKTASTRTSANATIAATRTRPSRIRIAEGSRARRRR